MNFDNTNDFVKHINGLRLLTGWFSFIGIVCGKNVEIKGYKTWLQIFRVDGINHGNCSDRKVGEFKHDLMVPFEKSVKHDYHQPLRN